VIADLGGLIQRHGFTKTLVVTDETLVETDVAQAACDFLEGPVSTIP
jgi:alcohol dehydrogenase class IV